MSTDVTTSSITVKGAQQFELMVPTEDTACTPNVEFELIEMPLGTGFNQAYNRYTDEMHTRIEDHQVLDDLGVLEERVATGTSMTLVQTLVNGTVNGELRFKYVEVAYAESTED